MRNGWVYISETLKNSLKFIAIKQLNLRQGNFYQSRQAVSFED